MRRLAGLLLVLAAAFAIPLPMREAAGAAAATSISRHVLANGLTVLIKETPGIDLTAVEVLARGGPHVEATDEAGISFFVLGVMIRGTERRSAADIGLALEGVGSTLVASGSTDYLRLGAMTLTQHTDVALDVLADITGNAKFDPVDIETVRRLNLTRIRQAADAPNSRVVELLSARLFPLHAYSNPVLGQVETVSAFSRDRLVAFYRGVFTAPNMVVSVAGSLPAETVLTKVQRVFAGTRADPLDRRIRLLPVVESALAPRPSERQEVREVRQTAASWIAIGFLAPRVGHRDWAALRVMSGILGEGLSSRLFVEIREKQGLAYQVGSSYPTRAGPSLITLIAGTDPANTTRVTEGLLREVTRLQETVPDTEELERAKQRIVGRAAIDHEDLQRQAFLLGFYELLGVGYAFDARQLDLIGAVRAEDVRRVARLYLRPPTVALVVPR